MSEKTEIFEIDIDELYPVYFIREKATNKRFARHNREIPTSLVARYYAARKEWGAVQGELRKIEEDGAT